MDKAQEFGYVFGIQHPAFDKLEREKMELRKKIAEIEDKIAEIQDKQILLCERIVTANKLKPVNNIDQASKFVPREYLQSIGVIEPGDAPRKLRHPRGQKQGTEK
jgi:hypothetical protein